MVGFFICSKSTNSLFSFFLNLIVRLSGFIVVWKDFSEIKCFVYGEVLRPDNLLCIAVKRSECECAKWPWK